MSPAREARLQAHWAAQIPAAVAHAVAKAAPDWSHAALSWRAGLLRSVPLMPARRPKKPWAVGLDVARLTVCLVVDEVEAARLPLAGSTLAEALTTFEETIGAHTGLEAPIALFEHALPAHPVGEGAPFGGADPSALSALAAWFATAAAALEAISAELPHASPVRCWPHHFDIATLVALTPEAPGPARSVGLGLSPGDARFPRPYLYASPWPYPSTPLPALARGHWHTEGFTAAVLPFDEEAPPPADDLRAWLLDAFAHSEATLTR